MKRSLLSSVAALVASAMTALVVWAPERAPKSAFGPCGWVVSEYIDSGFPPPVGVLPVDPERVDFAHPCFGAS